ncbi:MAG: translation elongation factor Ts [Verrucomicrobia bacterium]|nr:translation elongation factor Ts [Verrucomicrobiota bacterium]
MAEITAALVKELRDATNAGMMECKRALVETGGDKDAAVKLLRERGVAIAGKKASRAANEGLLAASVWNGGKSGVIVEVNCETDFVARNDNFQGFVGELVEKAKDVDNGELADAVKDELTAKIAEIGENLIVGRNVKYEAQGFGAVVSYIHLGGKVGVLLEIGCEKDETPSSDGFKEVAKDITLHIAASNPAHLTRDEVPANVVEEERAIFAKQVEGKPANIIDKIVDGKMNKYYSQVCLVDQEFVKDNALTITQLLETKGKEVGDTLTIRRFTRFQIGG